jgi:hypothetical protein
MRKMVLLVLVLTVGLTTNAQNFKFSGESEIDCEITTAVNEYNVVFTTNAPEAITYSWEVIENTLPADWDYSLCDYTACHIGIPNRADMTRISLEESKKGVQGFLKINVLTAESNGNYVAKFYVYDSLDHDRGDTVTFNFSNSTVSITEINNADALSIFPNPASEIVYFETSEINSDVVLTDLTGKVIKQERFQLVGINELDLTGLQPGFYQITVRSQNWFQSSRLVLND